MKNCILCNKPHLERRSEFRKVKIKSIEVEYEYFWDYCPELDLEFESEELIDENRDIIIILLSGMFILIFFNLINNLTRS